MALQEIGGSGQGTTPAYTIEQAIADAVVRLDAPRQLPPEDTRQVLSVNGAATYGEALMSRAETRHNTLVGGGLGAVFALPLAIFLATHGAPELAAAVVTIFTAAGGAGGNTHRRGQV